MKTRQKDSRYYRNGALRARRDNRKPEAIAEFEAELEKYCTTMRQLFRQGHTCAAAVSNNLSGHLHYAKQDLLNQKLEAFEEKQRAARRSKRAA